MKFKKLIWIAPLLAGALIVAGCGKKSEDEADKEKTAVKTNGGRLVVPPAEKHVSVSPPSKEMKGEWVLEPSEKQRETNAKLIARGQKPAEISLKIDGSQYELKVTAGPSERTEKGEAKQDGNKITLTAKSVDATVNGEKVETPVPGPQVFTLQEDGLTLKDEKGIVYVRL